MENLLHHIAAHNLQNRTVALIQNGSWAPTSGKQMKEIVESMKNMTILENMPTLKSAVKEDQLEQLQALADSIVETM